jgi:flagellin-specific chaperone FliS
MTRIFVDEREVASPPEASTLAEILKYLEDTYLSSDQVIRQIKLDGCSLEPDDLQHFSDSVRQIADGGKVEIFTGTLSAIAVDSIAEAVRYLDRVEQLTPSLAESFQISSGQESYESLGQLYEGFYWLNMLLEKLETRFAVNLDEVLIKEIPAREHLKKFLSILKQLIKSQEKGNLVRISDLLRHEILPLIPVWKQLFVIIAAEVQPTG